MSVQIYLIEFAPCVSFMLKFCRTSARVCPCRESASASAEPRPAAFFCLKHTRHRIRRVSNHRSICIVQRVPVTVAYGNCGVTGHGQPLTTAPSWRSPPDLNGAHSIYSSRMLNAMHYRLKVLSCSRLCSECFYDIEYEVASKRRSRS